MGEETVHKRFLSFVDASFLRLRSRNGITGSKSMNTFYGFDLVLFILSAGKKKLLEVRLLKSEYGEVEKMGKGIFQEENK